MLDIPSGIDKRCFQKSIMINAAVRPPSEECRYPNAFKSLNGVVKLGEEFVRFSSNNIVSGEEAEVLMAAAKVKRWQCVMCSSGMPCV